MQSEGIRDGRTSDRVSHKRFVGRKSSDTEMRGLLDGRTDRQTGERIDFGGVAWRGVASVTR